MRKQFSLSRIRLQLSVLENRLFFGSEMIRLFDLEGNDRIKKSFRRFFPGSYDSLNLNFFSVFLYVSGLFASLVADWSQPGDHAIYTNVARILLFTVSVCLLVLKNVHPFSKIGTTERGLIFYTAHLLSLIAYVTVCGLDGLDYSYSAGTLLVGIIILCLIMPFGVPIHVVLLTFVSHLSIFLALLISYDFDIPRPIQQSFFKASLCGFAMSYFVLHVHVKRFLSMHHRRLAEKNSENLERVLARLYPKEALEEMKASGKIKPRKHHTVVLFLDMVNFTSLSSCMSPDEVQKWLNEAFADMDRITSSFGAHRIKTIGDGYMAVLGLYDDASDDSLHREHLTLKSILMAKALIRIPLQIPQKNGNMAPVLIRIGLHAGDVSSGVVGDGQTFDIFGRTVNIASRLEALCRPGEVVASSEIMEVFKNSMNISEIFVSETDEGLTLHFKNEISFWKKERYPNVRGVGSIDAFALLGILKTDCLK